MTTRKNRRKSNSLRRIEIHDLLPCKPSQRAVDIAREREELYGYITVSRAEAAARLEQMAMEKEGEADHNLPVLGIRSNEVAAVHSRDAFEELRQKMGLDGVREEIEAAIFNRLSFEEGLAMFNHAVEKRAKRTFATIREVNELFPELTMLEISMFPLLVRVPATYLGYGTTFDADWQGRKPDSETSRLVPMRFASNTQCMVYCVDTAETERIFSGLVSPDGYSYLGLTGIGESMEYVPWKFLVRQYITSLVPLMISNQRLYECLWQGCTEGLQVGFGKISAEAFTQEFGAQATPPAKDLQARIRQLSGSDLKRFEIRRNRLEHMVFQSTVFDQARGLVLRKDELFRLVAILDRIPACLAGEASFYGYIVPYGTGVKFIDQSNKLVDYVPYSPWYVRESVVIFYGEVSNVSRDNRTVSVFFDRLMRQAEERVVNSYYQRGSELSLLEDIQMELWFEYKLRLEIVPRETIVGISDFWRDMGGHGITPNHNRVQVNIKFGVRQAQDIRSIVKMVPPAMLSNVKTIAKYNVSVLPLEMVMSGTFKVGRYRSETKAIELYQQYNEPYGEMTEARRAYYGFVLVHEIAESLWETLSAGQQAEWKFISWPKPSRENLHEHFLTWYSHAQNERDDFCDHFACYVMHAEEFRARAAASGPLASKYQFLKACFLQAAGAVIEYPAVLEWTIAELHGALSQEVSKKAMQDAIETIEENLENLQRRANSRIREVASSWEQLRKKEFRQEEEE